MYNIELCIIAALAAFFGYCYGFMISRHKRPLYNSQVKDYGGLCQAVWINTNQAYRRICMPREAIATGFFRLVRKNWMGLYVRTGKKFHGMIVDGLDVRSTEGIYK